MILLPLPLLTQSAQKLAIRLLLLRRGKMLSSDFCKKQSIRYCQANRPNVEVKGTKLVVVFKSHKRSKGGAGATCTATCASSETTTPAPATTPTTGLVKALVFFLGGGLFQ